MSERLKRKVWDWIRPIHGPITRELRRKLCRNYFAHPEMELPPPYEAIQLDVERHLHHYLHVSAAEVSQIVIVGAHEADEVERLNRGYPNARFLCFEPNPNTVRRVREKFSRRPQVTVSELALSRAPGKACFYELELPGNGSLLEPDVEDWARFTRSQAREPARFEVSVSTLDHEAAGITSVDLLWLDVQGAEGAVLDGASETLKRTRSIFVEVALGQFPYKGAAMFSEISERLEASHFTCVGLGADAGNGTGNAFFVKEFEKLVSK